MLRTTFRHLFTHKDVQALTASIRSAKKREKAKNRLAHVSVDDFFATMGTYTLGQDLPIQLHIQCANEVKPFRGEVQLPKSCGEQKTAAILVLAEGKQAEIAKKMGAAIVGGPELIPEIVDGTLVFDKILCTRDLFPHVVKIARILGPKGLMPSPAKKTVSDDVASMMTGLVSAQPFQINDDRTLQMDIGRTSWQQAEILSNLVSVGNALKNAAESMSNNKKRQPSNGVLQKVVLTCPHAPGFTFPHSKLYQMMNEHAE